MIHPVTGLPIDTYASSCPVHFSYCGQRCKHNPMPFPGPMRVTDPLPETKWRSVG